MAATRARALAAAIGLLAGGCIAENEYSIVDEPAAPDPRLAGVWALESGGAAQVLVIRRPDEQSPELSARFVLIGTGSEPPEASRATVKFTSIGGRSYFEAEWPPGEWLPLNPPVRRSFGTVELQQGRSGAPDRLRICLADSESFEQPLKSGALTGYPGTGKGYERRVVIASEGATLRAYLARHHFTCSAASVFQRVTGPKQQN
jgi:hypothetical protein